MNWHQMLFTPGTPQFPFQWQLFKCDGCGLNRLPLYLGRNARGEFVTLRCPTCRPN